MKMVPEARAVSCATPIVTSCGASKRRELSSHNVRRQGTLRPWLTIHSFNIGVLKPVKKNSATIKHIDNESANIIKGCKVALDTNDCRNFP